ncbi:MAG: PA14 domain-containing protein [Chloroflexota bacterium]
MKISVIVRKTSPLHQRDRHAIHNRFPSNSYCNAVACIVCNGGVILSLSPTTAIGSDQPTSTPCFAPGGKLAPTFVPDGGSLPSSTLSTSVVSVPCPTPTRTAIASPGTRIPLAQPLTLTPRPTKANEPPGNSPLVVSPGTGLYGRYFSDPALTTLYATRVDATINFSANWGNIPPPINPSTGIVPSIFSVRWTGQVVPLYSETYTFSGYSDQGMRLWIDGNYVVAGADRWNTWGNWTSTPIALEAGQKYDIRLEYWDDGCCNTQISMSWASVSQASQVIPQSQLYPEAQIDTIGTFKASSTQVPYNFFLRYSNTSGSAERYVTLPYSLAGDIPITGDWDGDGIDGIGLFRPSTGLWLLVNNTHYLPITAYDMAFTFGGPGDLPLAGHWKFGPDSAGAYHDGIGVYRSSTAQFLLRNDLSTGLVDYQMTLGYSNTDKGIVGDWNGDGVDSPGLFRPSNGMFYLSNAREVANSTITQDLSFAFGASTDIPFTGDWVGHGSSGVGMYATPSTVNLNYNLTSGVPNLTFTYGGAGFTPLAGKWDSFITYPTYKISIVNGGRAWDATEMTAINSGVAQIGHAFDLVSLKLKAPEAAFNQVMIENSGTEILFIRTLTPPNTFPTTVTINNYTYQYGTHKGQIAPTLTYNTGDIRNRCIAMQGGLVNNVLLPDAVICSDLLTDHYSGTTFTGLADTHTIIHELGHIFDYRTNNGLSGPIGASTFSIVDCNNVLVMDKTRRGERGWGTGPSHYLNGSGAPAPLITDLQQNPDNSAIESAADSFLNWVYRLTTSTTGAVNSCALNPTPAYNQWTGPGFRNLQWSATPGAFPANSAGAVGTPDARLPGDNRYLDVDGRIRQLFTTNGW